MHGCCGVVERDSVYYGYRIKKEFVCFCVEWWQFQLLLTPIAYEYTKITLFLDCTTQISANHIWFTAQKGYTNLIRISRIQFHCERHLFEWLIFIHAYVRWMEDGWPKSREYFVADTRNTICIEFIDVCWNWKINRIDWFTLYLTVMKTKLNRLSEIMLTMNDW